VTGPNLGAAARSDDGASPLVRVSASALRDNALRLRYAAPGPVADASAADAYGHGVDWVRSILSDVDDIDLAATDAESLYGLREDTRPVMRLSGTVLSTKTLRAGEGVSYGYTHRATTDTRIALVSGGYAQGVVRGLGNRIGVRVGDAFRPVIGRVAMDACVVDVDDADVHRGDEVVFFGDPGRGEPSILAWAELLGWSAAELVATVGRRSPREVVE
jgi:alanine racemase